MRIKTGERVLLHILNGSTTQILSLTLPGHTFEVIAVDGNPVPHAGSVPVLWIGTAERTRAVAEMATLAYGCLAIWRMTTANAA